MLLRPLILAAAAAVATPAFAQTPASTGSAETATNAPDVASVPVARRQLLALQVLLDRAGFAPGVIDGQTGSNTRNALTAWRKAHGETATASVTPALIKTLAAQDAKPVLARFVIGAQDVAGPFEAIPQPIDYKVLAQRKTLGWQSPLEALAERFHTSEQFLKLLNPGADFARAGQEIVVPAVGRAPLRSKVVKVEVDKAKRQVRAYAEGGDLLAVYPASIGSADTPTPEGTWKVRAVADKPTYSYDPARLTKAKQGDEKLMLPAGPNNPVGVTWIDLSKDTYGIHGTPEPRLIGKTQSSGCVRLTNWDAWQLAQSIETGATVTFVG